MGDPGDQQLLADSVLAVGLGRAEPAGLLAVYDVYGADLLGYAEFLLTGRDSAAVPHLADDAAAAVLDALLVAAGAVVDLTDPDRMRSWLLSLTRNECLRRRPGPVGVPPAREAAELARRGMPEAEIVGLLGSAPEPGPDAAGAAGDGVAPAWLRPALAGVGGPAGAARRAELTRRARPFEPDGFPVPLDRRRLSGRALAWSAAAVVAIALAVLVVVPGGGGAVALPPGPVPFAAGPGSAAEQAATTPPDEPLPTLADAPFSTGGPGPGPADAAPTTSAAPPARPNTENPPADRSARIGRLSLTWSAAEGFDCGEAWTVDLRATAIGVEVSSVVAAVGGDRVALTRDGEGWSGRLSGLPTDRAVTVVVSADGPVRPATGRLRPDC